MKNLIFLKKAYPWIALFLLLATVFAVRFSILGKYPPSDDMGGHLANLKTCFHGLNIRPERRFHHPPLYYILVLEPLILLFPTFLALNAAAALASTIIAVPMFFLVKEVTGNDKAAIISSFLLTFSELYSEITCWGGVPNLFGIFFMLFSISFLYKAVEDNSWKNTLLAGIFFSFTVGAHHLTALYYMIVLVICIPLFVTLKAVKPKSLLKNFLLLAVITALLSLPYLDVYLFLFYQRVNVATGFRPDIELYYSSLSVSFFTVTREWPAMLSLVAIVAASAVNLWRHHRRRIVTGILVSLGISVFALALILHPSLMARAFYFLLVPIFLAFGVLLSDVFTRLRRRNLLQKVFFYVLLTTAVLSLTSAAYSRMIVAKSYYQSLNGETVEALDWIEQYTNKNAVILNNYNMLHGWIEGYSERKTISPRELDILVKSYEYQESITAKEILSGNHIVMNSYLLVSDCFPAGYYNPQIAVKTREWYQKLIFFQDPWQTLSSQKNDSTQNSSSAKTVDDVTQTNSSVNITYRYSSDWALLTRRVEIRPNPQIDIIYDLKLTNTSIDGFAIPICVFTENEVDSYVIDDEEVVLSLVTSYGEVGGIRIYVVETNSKAVNVTFSVDPTTEQPTFVFTLHPEGSELHAHFRVLLGLEIEYTDGVEYLTAQELLKNSNITHVLLDKKRALDLYRFTCETDRYETIFENDALLIVEVEK